MTGIAFIVLAQGSDSMLDRTVLRTPAFDLSVVAVPNYAVAVEVAKELHAGGINLIELCGGFGHEGTALVCAAIPAARVGVVRFDGHPGLQGESGDHHFAG